MATYAEALTEELQHKVGDVEAAARACLDHGCWTPNSKGSSTRELHNYLQQLQYLLDRLEGFLRDQQDFGNARSHKQEILGAVGAANVASTALAAIQTFGCTPDLGHHAFTTAWLQFHRLEVAVTRLPALVHQYFNAQQCEDMPAGLSLYGNLAAPLPQHMAAIRQSLVNDHAMYLEEVHQRLAALLPPSAAAVLHASLDSVHHQFVLALDGQQAQAAAPQQHTWGTQTELSFDNSVPFASWGAKHASTQTDVKHCCAAVQTASMGTDAECQTDLPPMARRVASASSLPSLAYLLAPTPGSPESALMVSQACQTHPQAEPQVAEASMQTDSGPIALPASFEDYAAADAGVDASSQTQGLPRLASLSAVTQTETHPRQQGARSAPTTPAAGAASAGIRAIHDMRRSVGSVQEPAAPSTPRLTGHSHMQASLADMMSFEEVPQQPALHISSHLMYPPSETPEDQEGSDMLPCWERGPAAAWPQPFAAEQSEPVNMHLLRGCLSDDEACQPLIAPACTPSASLCLDPTLPEQHWAMQEPFAWDLEFSPFEPFLHANGVQNARSCAQPTLTVALRHGQGGLSPVEDQAHEAQQAASSPAEAGVPSRTATWEIFARARMEDVADQQPSASPVMQPESESDSDADTEYEFVEHDEPMPTA